MPSSGLASIPSRLLRVRSGEWASFGRSGAYFALVLFGYFLLRPAREAMGVSRSMDDLRWLFVATCVASAVVALGFGGVVSRCDRAKAITIGHLFVAACVVLFAVVRPLVGDEAKLTLGYVFYVWLSVVNLFLTSLFWAYMADVWSFEQTKRLFPPIAVGGTVGAFAGSTFAWQLAELIGSTWLLLIAATCFLLTVPLVRGLDRRERAESGETKRPIGGRWTEGFVSLVRSPYLIGIAIYILLIAISTTFLYFTRADLVADASEELEARIALFAQMDQWTQGATLFVQLFITGRLIRRLGVGPTLAVLPLVTVAGFALLAWLESRPGIEGWQLFGAVAGFSAIHSATRFAIARPTRETLFSVVSDEDKYKAKQVIDVVLFRGGDVAGAWITGLVAGLWGLFALALPLAALWAGVGLWLAAVQTRRAERNELDRHATPAGAPPREGIIP